MHQSKMDGWLRWRVIAAAQPALYAGSVPSLIAAWKKKPYLFINIDRSVTLTLVNDRHYPAHFAHLKEWAYTTGSSGETKIPTSSRAS